MIEILVIARMTLMRLVRGRSLWISVLLAVMPIAFAVLLASQRASAADAREAVGAMTVRLLILVAAALLLAPAIAEEVELGTISYLWSRPVPRASVPLGKVVAIAPLLMIAFGVSLAIAWSITSTGGDEWGLRPGPPLLRVELVMMGEILAACLFAVGAGAVFPKHPFVFVMAYVLLGEQTLSFVPGFASLSIAHHALEAAQLPSGGTEEKLANAIGGMIVLAVLWLGIGLWRLGRTEYVKVDQ
jgi:ABC-2 type transport system permease protein